MDRKEIVRKFYEREYIKYFQVNGWEGTITDFKYNYLILEWGLDPENFHWENYSEDDLLFFDEQLSKKESPCQLSTNLKLNHKVPNFLLKACDRIYWYLKHLYGTFSIIKVTVNNTDTFTICISGYVDNCCQLMEIWDNSGDLIGSVYPNMDEEDRNIFNWKDRPIKGHDFNGSAFEW